MTLQEICDGIQSAPSGSREFYALISDLMHERYEKEGRRGKENCGHGQVNGQAEGQASR